MTFEPIITSFLLWDLKKILHKTSPIPTVDKKIKLAMYVVVGLFLIENIFISKRSNQMELAFASL